MKKSAGFTLLEIVVVIGIIAIALPAAFAIIFAIIRQQARVYALKQVKREGDFILNTMEDQIRNNAVGIFTDSQFQTEVCNQTSTSYNPDDSNNFYFQDKLGNMFHYYLKNYSPSSVYGEVALESAGSLTILTTSTVEISNFKLSCFRSNVYSPPIVSISFDISYANNSFYEQVAHIHYQTQVAMKNY